MSELSEKYWFGYLTGKTCHCGREAVTKNRTQIMINMQMKSSHIVWLPVCAVCNQEKVKLEDALYFNSYFQKWMKHNISVLNRAEE